jgi:AraC-like DNA-binding protein
MDNFSIHLAPVRRRFPNEVSVGSIGYCPQKRSPVNSTFSTLNFSFILSGGGSYHFRGKTTTLEAPCVITQWPGEPVRYGPSAPWDQWEELFMIFPAEQLPALKARHLAVEQKPIWQVRRPTPMLEQLASIRELLPRLNEGGAADRIDRACEMMILESHLGEHRPALEREEAIVQAIRRRVRADLGAHHNFDKLAREHGISPGTFRRYWARYVSLPPARYVMDLRMREARRLLIETSLTIAEIAGKLGFADPLYFSRCFAATQGLPATAYRRQHRVGL